MGEHVYFVCYGHSVGQGMLEVTLSNPIETFDDVQAIKEYIDKDINDNVVIINWIPIKAREQKQEV